MANDVGVGVKQTREQGERDQQESKLWKRSLKTTRRPVRDDKAREEQGKLQKRADAAAPREKPIPLMKKRADRMPTEKMEEIAPSFKRGGVKRTAGPAKLHRDEKVVKNKRKGKRVRGRE